MGERIFKQGQGWRLGFDPHRSPYSFLIGGEEWAIELTPAEFDDFHRLTQELRRTVLAIAPELMAEETLHCELDSETLWLEIEGYPHAYELRLILHQGRRAEGQWAASVLPEFFVALDQIHIGT
ncbi:MAG: DUF1818 family protein [Synechocystis sp.]